MTVVALTSISPARLDHQLRCIETWKKSGLRVVTFNNANEIQHYKSLGKTDIEYVEAAETTESIFGKPHVPINCMLDWAGRERAHALIINSDIQFDIDPSELERLRSITEKGLCYFIRYDYEGDTSRGVKQAAGIDAFMLHGDHARLFPKSFLSMGQPWWDFWLPYTFIKNDLPVWSAENKRIAHHWRHPQNWSEIAWARCALEFGRMHPECGIALGAQMKDVINISRHIRDKVIEQNRVLL